jgi:hypothetical protein
MHSLPGVSHRNRHAIADLQRSQTQHHGSSRRCVGEMLLLQLVVVDREKAKIESVPAESSKQSR